MGQVLKINTRDLQKIAKPIMEKASQLVSVIEGHKIETVLAGAASIFALDDLRVRIKASKEKKEHKKRDTLTTKALQQQQSQITYLAEKAEQAEELAKYIESIKEQREEK